jgi:hypothetical protein
MNNASEKNKQLVLKGFDTLLFNKRDYVAAEVLVATLYQLVHTSTGARRIVQSREEPPADSEIRAR